MLPLLAVVGMAVTNQALNASLMELVFNGFWRAAEITDVEVSKGDTFGRVYWYVPDIPVPIHCACVGVANPEGGMTDATSLKYARPSECPVVLSPSWLMDIYTIRTDFKKVIQPVLSQHE